MPDYFEYIEKPVNWDKFPLFGIEDEKLCIPPAAKSRLITSLEQRYYHVKRIKNRAKRKGEYYRNDEYFVNNEFERKDLVKIIDILKAIPECNTPEEVTTGYRISLDFRGAFREWLGRTV